MTAVAPTIGRRAGSTPALSPFESIGRRAGSTPALSPFESIGRRAGSTPALSPFESIEPEEDGLVFEPPSISDACDPAGDPFAVTPDPVAPPRRSRISALLVPVLVLGGVIAGSIAESAYTFGWLEEDGRFTVADTRWSDSGLTPISRVSLVIGTNEEIEYEIALQPAGRALLHLDED